MANTRGLYLDHRTGGGALNGSTAPDSTSAQDPGASLAPWAPRSAGLDLVGQLGGTSSAVAFGLESDTLFVGVGPRVWRVDLCREPPRFVSASPILGGVVAQLQRHDGLLLAAAGQAGLVLFDLEQGEQGWSRPVGSLSQAGRVVVGMSAANGEALLVDRPLTSGSRLGDRALIVDLSDPAAPSAGPGIRWPTLVSAALHEDIMILVSQAGLVTQARRRESRGEPEWLSIDPRLAGRSLGVRLLGGEPWILTLGGLARVDLVPDSDDPTQDRLTVIEEIDLGEPALEAVSNGEEAWLLDQSNGLWRMPLASPSQLAHTRSVGAGPMAVGSGWLAIAEGDGVQLLGFPPASDPQDDWVQGRLESPPPHLPYRAGMHGGCALAGDYLAPDTPARWVDLSQPEDPGYLGDLDVARPWDISAGPETFYVAPDAETVDRLILAECGSTTPRLRLDVPEQPASIARTSRYGLLALGYKLGLLDLHDPLRPRLLLEWPRQPFDAAVSQVAIGDKLWAALLPGEVRLGRFAPPSEPTLEATVPVPAGTGGLLLAGRTMLVSTVGTITAIDLADPSRPRVSAAIDVPGVPRTFASGAPGRVWAILDDRGGQATLRLLDLGGGGLRERAWTDLPGTGWHVAASGRTALVSAGDAGLLVVRDPATPDGPTIHLPLLLGDLSP